MKQLNEHREQKKKNTLVLVKECNQDIKFIARCKCYKNDIIQEFYLLFFLRFDDET